jgi:flagellin-like protein
MWETLCISTQSVNMHLLKLKLTRNASSDMSFQSAITGTIILIQVTVSLFLIMDQRKYLKYYRGEILTILLLLCLWEK